VAFVYRRRVRFGDTDPYGVLYFAALLDYFKEAVDEFIRSRGKNPSEIYRNEDREFGFPVVRVEADYLRPVKYDEELLIECEVEKVGKRSVTLRLNALRGDLFVATGTMSFVSISPSWKSVPLPQELLEVFSPTSR